MDINKLRVAALKAVMAGASQKEFADQYGLDASYLSQILNGHRNLGEKAALRLEEKIGLDSGTLVSPAAATDPDTVVPQEQPAASASAADLVKQMLAKSGKGIPEETRQRLLAAAEEPASSNVISVDFSRPGLVGDEVWIAHYDVRGSMGGGQVTHDHPEMLQDVRVSPKHLRELGVEFKEHFHLKLVTGWGQSMAPTIKNRDPLIVDVSIREFVGDGIYYFSWGGHEYIKRLQIADEDHFEMISDNPKHKDRMIRREETYIQARVLLVWNAHLV
ncbi:XRE family transcriptional regulator [Pseudomonas guariconensis]|uniref:XRE family transcriptional regulator n=1 Tax=Pseudomonas TaxID=286 RepID=UPI00209A94D1|nr:XRE family transcriptional regulator [Pseudomonas guariconensis]MCO7634103.1 XRE family transcriptional regulator [Pseudomonas guariconensis]